MTPFQAYLPEYNCIHVANFSHLFSNKTSPLFLIFIDRLPFVFIEIRSPGNDFWWNTIFGNANIEYVGIRVFQGEKEKRKRRAGPVIQEAHGRKRYTGVTRRASVQLENFFFGLLLSPPFSLSLSPLQLFYARCFHPRAIYGPSERHSVRPSPVL